MDTMELFNQLQTRIDAHAEKHGMTQEQKADYVQHDLLPHMERLVAEGRSFSNATTVQVAELVALLKGQGVPDSLWNEVLAPFGLDDASRAKAQPVAGATGSYVILAGGYPGLDSYYAHVRFASREEAEQEMLALREKGIYVGIQPCQPIWYAPEDVETPSSLVEKMVDLMVLANQDVVYQVAPGVYLLANAGDTPEQARLELSIAIGQWKDWEVVYKDA